MHSPYATCSKNFDTRCLCSIHGSRNGCSSTFSLRNGGSKITLADFEQVISISPNVSAGYKNAGFLYLLQNDKMKAKNYLTRAQEITPDDPKVREALRELK